MACTSRAKVLLWLESACRRISATIQLAKCSRTSPKSKDANPVSGDCWGIIVTDTMLARYDPPLEGHSVGQRLNWEYRALLASGAFFD
jgi:hypothetical protein